MITINGPMWDHSMDVFKGVFYSQFAAQILRTYGFQVEVVDAPDCEYSYLAENDNEETATADVYFSRS